MNSCLKLSVLGRVNWMKDTDFLQTKFDTDKFCQIFELPFDFWIEWALLSLNLDIMRKIAAPAKSWHFPMQLHIFYKCVYIEAISDTSIGSENRYIYKKKNTNKTVKIKKIKKSSDNMNNEHIWRTNLTLITQHSCKWHNRHCTFRYQGLVHFLYIAVLSSQEDDRSLKSTTSVGNKLFLFWRSWSGYSAKVHSQDGWSPCCCCHCMILHLLSILTPPVWSSLIN